MNLFIFFVLLIITAGLLYIGARVFLWATLSLAKSLLAFGQLVRSDSKRSEQAVMPNSASPCTESTETTSVNRRQDNQSQSLNDRELEIPTYLRKGKLIW